jgi:hypothetical protein
MAVYIIAIVVVILVLVSAYRALGGASSRPIDPAALLRSLHAELSGSLENLQAALSAAGRRRTAAIQQTLDGLPPDSQLDDAQAAARALLIAATEDAAWAWRMLEAGPPGPGLAQAMLVLCEHAARCCAEAGPLVNATAGGEPPDGAGDALLEPGAGLPVEQLGGAADVKA